MFFLLILGKYYSEADKQTWKDSSKLYFRTAFDAGKQDLS